jgi:hypothetical protein
MEREIEEARKTAEELEVVVVRAEDAEDGVEKTKKIRSSFKTASQMPRHTQSDKVFTSLYDDTKPVLLAQYGSGWVHPSKTSWTETEDGPHVCVLGFFASHEKATVQAYRIKKAIKRHGYKLYPMESAPSSGWVVLRRHAPRNVVDDETLCRNIIHYAQRYIKYIDVEFAKEMRKRDRPVEKPPDRPDTLHTIYPNALKSTQRTLRKLDKATRRGLKALAKDKTLSHKQLRKAKTRLKQLQRGTVKGMYQHVPPHGRLPHQKFCAVAYVLSPKYERIDETKHFGDPAVDKKDDPAPDKIYGPEDFDEAMVVHPLQAFETEDECREFINNKAKHDLEFGHVVCMEMYVHTAMDEVITNRFRATVDRGYITDMLQKTVVDKEKHSKLAAAVAKANPDAASEVTVNQDGQVHVEEAKVTRAIREELEREKAKTDAEYSTEQARLAQEAQEAQEAANTGGGSKTGPPDFIDLVEVMPGDELGSILEETVQETEAGKAEDAEEAEAVEEAEGVEAEEVVGDEAIEEGAEAEEVQTAEEAEAE